MHTYFHIVYPANKLVRDDTIERWFMEARAANEIALDYVGAREPALMAEALQDMGFIRLHQESAQ